MAITKAQAGSLSNDMLMRGVIETIVKESAILNFLPFTEITGTSLAYSREATMPAATFYTVGDTWTEATPTWTRHIANLTILGGDADVDNFLQQTYTDANDLEAEVIASRRRPSPTSSATRSSTATSPPTPRASTASTSSSPPARPSPWAPTAAR